MDSLDWSWTLLTKTAYDCLHPRNVKDTMFCWPLDHYCLIRSSFLCVFVFPHTGFQIHIKLFLLNYIKTILSYNCFWNCEILWFLFVGAVDLSQKYQDYVFWSQFVFVRAVMQLYEPLKNILQMVAPSQVENTPNFVEISTTIIWCKSIRVRIFSWFPLPCSVWSSNIV